MSSAACPLCNRRYALSFLPLHASSCGLSLKRSLTKPTKEHTSASKAIVKKRPSTSSPKLVPLGPRYLTRPSPSSPPSETGAPGFHVFRTAFNDVEALLLRDVETAAPRWIDYAFRLTKNYGPGYDLRRKRFLFGASAPAMIPFPAYATDMILPRLRMLTPLLQDFYPNQLTAGLYRGKDSHILPHNDCDNGIIRTAVVGVCLGASCTMTLILRAKKSGLGRDVKRDVVLPRGAVYIMSSDALRVWEHAIFPGKTKGARISLTFRDVGPHKGEQNRSSVRGKYDAKKRGFIQSSLR